MMSINVQLSRKFLMFICIVTVCSEVNVVEEFRRWQNKEALFVGIS